jgi:hypothetical protein
MTASPEDRHLDADGLTEYLQAGAPALVTIDGTPQLTLVIEPSTPRIAIRSPYDGADLPDLSHYRHLALTVGTAAGHDWVEFGVSGDADLLQAYPVLRAVADHVQLEGDDVGTAVREVLRAYHQIMSSLGRLTEHQETGLVGELVVLNHLITTIGERAAIESWRGPLGEEHDFGLADIDVEVKTTLAEQRAHRISSLTQLVPNPDRPLWLVSVQLTVGGVAAQSLSQRVLTVADGLSSNELRHAFMAKVEHLGWVPTQGDLYTRRFIIRGEILTYAVGLTFPAITPAHLVQGRVPLDRIRGLSYVLVLDGLPPDSPPETIERIGARP